MLMSILTIAELALWQSAEFPFTLLGVRRAQKRRAEGDQIAGGRWLDPALWLDWKDEFAASPQPVVLYCAHGHEISQGLTAALRAMGADARHLDGGIEAWRHAGHAVVRLG
jgi:rhodanese-related sulfurtransferase